MSVGHSQMSFSAVLKLESIMYTRIHSLEAKLIKLVPKGAVVGFKTLGGGGYRPPQIKR